MAVAYRSTVLTAGGNASTVTFTEPSGTVSGDILIAIVYFESTGSVTPPAGWSSSFNGTTLAQSLSAEGPWTATAFWIRRGASAPGLVFTLPGSHYSQGQITSYSGAETSGDPFSFAAETTRNTTAATTFPAVSGTTSRASEMLVWTGMNFVGGTASAPSTFTGRTLTTGADVFWADKVQTSAGATGSITSSWSGANGTASAMLMGLMPPSGGSSIAVTAICGVAVAGTAAAARTAAATGIVGIGVAPTGAGAHALAGVGTAAAAVSSSAIVALASNGAAAASFGTGATAATSRTTAAEAPASFGVAQTATVSANTDVAAEAILSSAIAVTATAGRTVTAAAVAAAGVAPAATASRTLGAAAAASVGFAPTATGIHSTPAEATAALAVAIVATISASTDVASTANLGFGIAPTAVAQHATIGEAAASFGVGQRATVSRTFAAEAIAATGVGVTATVQLRTPAMARLDAAFATTAAAAITHAMTALAGFAVTVISLDRVADTPGRMSLNYYAPTMTMQFGGATIVVDYAAAFITISYSED